MKEKIMAMLKKRFPKMAFSQYENDNEIFISVSDIEFYKSEEYMQYVLDLKTEHLWANGVYNIFFIYEEAGEKSPARDYIKIKEQGANFKRNIKASHKPNYPSAYKRNRAERAKK